MKSVFYQCCVIGFIHGNMSLEEAITFQNMIEMFLEDSTNVQIVDDLSKHFPPRQIFNVPIANNSMGKTLVFTTSVRSSSILVYFQVHLDSVPSSPSMNSKIITSLDLDSRETRLHCQLLAQLLKEPLFHTLRTKKQLAYYAHVAFHRCETSFGITVEVSSHHTGTVALVHQVDTFLSEFYREILTQMSNLDFTRHLRALELRKLEKDFGPNEEARRHFNSIIKGIETGKYEWNAEASETEAMRFITKSSICDFFQRVISPESSDRRKLTILVVGHAEMSEKLNRSSRKLLAQVSEGKEETREEGKKNSWWPRGLLHTRKSIS